MFSVSTNTYIGYTIEDAFKGIANAGFRYIEIASSGCKGWTEHISAGMSDSFLNKYIDKLKSLALQPIALSGYGNIACTERHAEFIKMFDLAVKLGCRYVVDAPDGPDGETLPLDELTHVLEKLGGECEKRGLKLALEIHGEKYPDGESIFNALKKVQCSAVGINFDTANCIYYGGKNPLEDLKTCIDKVNYIHLKDKIGGKGVWNFPAVGKGETDFHSIFRFLRQVGYKDNISVEIEFTPKGSGSLENVNKAVKDSYDYLDRSGFFI